MKQDPRVELRLQALRMRAGLLSTPRLIPRLQALLSHSEGFAVDWTSSQEVV